MTTHQTPQPEPARPAWWGERDVDAVEARLWPWIWAVGDVEIPPLGGPDWPDATPQVQMASVAVFVLGCLVERDPLVIAARLAAEVATARAVRCAAARQASEAIAAAADWSAVANRLVQRASGDGTRAGAR
ncbi:hypothetical protein ACFQ34_21520 [Pseudonocardia benzenivorans]|uniref:DUF2742 domain-containing protein n=1 Tax=Pseudonocardia benzenivorans TaxID=228005 RepID=A0ABW3VLV4_9PSEU